MDWNLEVIVVPVSDVDPFEEVLHGAAGVQRRRRSSGRRLPHRAADAPRVGLSITFGTKINPSEPGTLGGLQVTVSDIEQAHRELVERGVDAGEIRHFEHGQPVPGPDPDRAAFNSFVFFADPDGNR